MMRKPCEYARVVGKTNIILCGTCGRNFLGAENKSTGMTVSEIY